MMRFVEISGPLAGISWFVNLGILGLIWWCADRLTWDCTVIDERDKGSGEGLLQTVGLDDFRDHAPYQLSGGMQQRANLCRALIHEPDLLLLDEPFAALDAFTREELWAVLQDLWLEQRFTVILVTHDLREAVYLADTVHVVSKRPGRIVESRQVDLPRLDDRLH